MLQLHSHWWPSRAFLSPPFSIWHLRILNRRHKMVQHFVVQTHSYGNGCMRPWTGLSRRPLKPHTSYCLLQVTRPMPFSDIVLSSSASCCNSLNFLWNSSKIFEWYFEHVYLIPVQLWHLILSFQKYDFWLSGLKYSIHGMSSSTW